MSLYNLRNPAVKRLMKEAEELLQPTDEYHAQPVEDNLFEWHFSIRGPPNSDYEGGIYHGRITLPPDYPMKPPSIILLTPNGRFETNKKICLSISGHHPESWQPSWSIRTALLAIIGFMPTHGNGALGSLDYTPEERKQLALKSQDFKCSECGYIKDIFQKKKSECLDTSTSQESLSDLENNQTDSTVTSSNKAHTDSSENLILQQVHIKDGENSLVHRYKSTPSQATNDEAMQVSAKSDHNLLYSMFVFVLVAIIVFLVFRRIFSM